MKRRLDAASRADRHEHLQTLVELGISASKLLKVFEKFRNCSDLLDKPVNLRNIRDAQEDVFRRVSICRKVILDDGSEFDWEFCNFGKVLDVLSSECCEFGSVLRELQSLQPSSMAEPWGLVVYFDETVPGDPLRLDQRKKFMAVYVAIKNLGATYLKHERFWIPVAICRTNIVKQVPGKWSQMLKIVLRSILLDEPNVRCGVPLQCLNQNLVFFKVTNLLGDEDGLRQGWSHKGAAGVFPCMTCLNVCSCGARSVVRPDERFFVDIACTDETQFRRCEDSDVWHKVDLLAALVHRVTKTQLEAKETALGLNHNPEGLLLDVELRPFVRPITVQTHDPTHVFFSDGLCNTELNLLLPKLAELEPPVTVEILLIYLSAAWKLPRAFRATTSLTSIFSPHRVKHFRRVGKVQAFASELMTVVPPLAHFLHMHAVRTKLPDEIASFMELAVLVRMLARAKMGKMNPDTLSQALARHGNAFKRAYQGDGIKAKFHYARELPYQLQRDGMLLDTFTCERKHSMMKTAAEPIVNTSRFERSCLSRALTLHLATLREGIADALVRPEGSPEIASLLGFASCSIAKDIRVDGTLMGVGDVLWIAGRTCVQIICPMSAKFEEDNAADPSRLGFLVEVLDFVEQVLNC